MKFAGLPPTALFGGAVLYPIAYEERPMKMLEVACLVGVSFIVIAGCSAKTKEEAKEALEATTEAAAAAGEDIKANVKKGSEVFEAGVDSAKEKAAEIRSESPAGDSPDDADAVPEAEEKP
jgi:hypothetical protein